MSSWSEGVELRVTGFDKTEQEAKFPLPTLTYKIEDEDYYPQTDFSWCEWSIKNEEKGTSTVFTKRHYTVLTALMNNLERILVDGSHAPREDCFQGHYLAGSGVSAVSYVIEEIDNATGKVLFRKEIDTVPNVVHDVATWEKHNLKQPAIVTEKKQMIELMEINPRFYELADPSLKEDEELAKKAIEGSEFNYEVLDERFKARRDFQLAAVAYYPFMLRVLPKEALKDYAFLLEACKRNKSILSEDIIDDDIKNRIKKELNILD